MMSSLNLQGVLDPVESVNTKSNDSGEGPLLSLAVVPTTLKCWTLGGASEGIQCGV
jgi:hypothetical protein